MYTEYWQLESPPFGPTADRRFYYPAESHHGALSKLRYVVDSGGAAAMLVGQTGTGKTRLVQVLQEQLPENVTPIVSVVFPQMSGKDLLVYLAERLGAPQADPPRHTVEESVRRLELVLTENARVGRRAVIVIDDADLLETTDALETLRLLLNFEWEGQPCCTLLLVGSCALLSAVGRRPSLEARVAVKSLLRPFSPEETTAYVQHRLQAAGATRDLFDDSALEAIQVLSQGVARAIDRLGDLSLLIGFAERLPTISSQQIEAVSSELITLAAA